MIALTTSSTLDLRAPSQQSLEVRFAQAARTKRTGTHAVRDIDSPSKSTQDTTGTLVVREAGRLHSQSRGALDVEMARELAPALQLLERLLHRHAVRRQYLGAGKSAVTPAGFTPHGQQANHHPARLRDRQARWGIVARVVNGIYVRAVKEGAWH